MIVQLSLGIVPGRASFKDVPLVCVVPLQRPGCLPVDGAIVLPWYRS